MNKSDSGIEKMRKSNPAYCYLFDCLYMDGRSLLNEPLTKRKIWLKDSVRGDTPYRLSEHVEDGISLFEAAREHSLEGIMAKERNSKYYPGKRSDQWLKIKVRNSVECVIIGYTQGKGDRSAGFGALQIAEISNDKLIYRGKVGTGFTDSMMKEVLVVLKKLKTSKKPLKEKLLDEKSSTWCTPEVVAEISYAMITDQGMYREPVFLRLRPDISINA
ncbi:MAG: hypothetical protein HC811_12555 [Flammeovirgaceae bacterium]|nr:hypothetical protein [Flammeovirgaceae bacterium]